MPEWRAQIRGEAFELEDLARALTAPDLNIIEEDGRYYLRAAAFAGFTEAHEVATCADALLPLIQGATRVHHGDVEPLHTERIVRVHEDGRQERFVFGSASLRGRARLTGALTGGGLVAPTTPGDTIASRVEIARRAPEVELALRFFATRPNWFDLYKVWEIVRGNVGGGKRALIKRGWGTKDDHNRFTYSANNYRASGMAARHAPGAAEESSLSPMSLEDAQEFIRTLLDNWIRTK